MKRYKDFLTENNSNINVFEGDFKVFKEMISEGKFIEGKIPKVINGNFYCDFNNLTSLEFGPEKVNGEFDCSNNLLTSLKFSPKEVNGLFDCSCNQLTSLEFVPEKVNDYFDCSSNELTSLEFGPKEINGDFYCYANSITSLEFGPKKVSGKFDCSNNAKDLEIEKDFIKRGMFNSDYYKELLDYILSNDINIEEIKTWPEGFLSDNMKRSIKGKQKFNL